MGVALRIKLTNRWDASVLQAASCGLTRVLEAALRQSGFPTSRRGIYLVGTFVTPPRATPI